MEPNILHCQEVEAKTRLSKVTSYRQIHAGTFPSAVKKTATENDWPLDKTSDAESGGHSNV